MNTDAFGLEIDFRKQNKATSSNFSRITQEQYQYALQNNYEGVL